MSAMKEMFIMMEEMMKNDKEHHDESEKINLRECTNEGKGYKTIIPDETYDKVKNLMDCFDEVMMSLKNTLGHQLSSIDEVPDDQKDYALLEFALFSEMLKEAWEKITDLVAVHVILDKESIDRQCEEAGITPKQVFRMKMMNDMMDIMCKMH